MDFSTNINELQQYLKNSSKTVILTGAGMSTESGVPDFRSASGWWKQIDPHKVATVEALEQDYSLFHEFYTARLQALETCQPHEGHYILAEWEKKGYVHSVATQNVDGFHLAAGSEHVEELHGSIHTCRCHQCAQAASIDSFLAKEPCQHCGGKLRPNVVLFGEQLPEDCWMRALRNIKEADVVIVIGTSLEVYPVNQLPMMTKGKTVLVNKELPTHSPYFHLTIEGKAKEVLQQVNSFL